MFKKNLMLSYDGSVIQYFSPILSNTIIGWKI